MNTLIVNISIPADRFVALYEGEIHNVQATANNGQSVRFPGNCLKRFVTREGVQGRFEIQFDANNRFRAIRRLDG